MINRRAFLSSGVTLAASVGAGRSLLAIAAGADDDVFNHVAAEIALNYRRGRDRWRPEHTRALAVQVRLFARHGGAVHLNEKARSGLQARIRDVGRDAVLDTPLDHERMMRDMNALGIDMRDERMPEPGLTRESRGAMVDAIVAGRLSLTERLSVLAEHLDAHAAQQERQGGGNGQLRQVAFQGGNCDIIQGDVLFLESMMLVVCEILPEACLGFIALYLSVKATAWWAGCGG